MYKIKNKFKDVRKFRDGFLGKDVFVKPGETVLVKKRIEENSVFSVEIAKEKEKKEKKNEITKFEEDK